MREQDFLAKVPNPFSVDDIPVDILNDFQSLLDDPEDVPADRGDGVGPSENLPADGDRDASPQRPAPPVMQAAGEPSQPLAFRPPSPCMPCDVKAEASSDSDLEVLYIKPAPKRPRRSSVPVVPVKLEEDASGSAQLPLVTPSTGTGSADCKGFCQQGHDLKLVPPPANIILNQSEYAYFNVSCDVCSIRIAGDFYRCDVCELDYCFACAQTKPAGSRRFCS